MTRCCPLLLWGTLCIAICLFSGCSDKRTVFVRLSEADSLLQTNPAAALDSLSLLNPASLQGHEKAYFSLLHTIALHKNQIPFTNDSSIAASRAWYAKQDNDAYNQARAFFYHGLVLHLLSKDEEEACHLMHEALQLLNQHSIQDDKLTALACVYLGQINDKKEHNLPEAITYYRKAVEAELRLGNPRNLILDVCDLLTCLVKQQDSEAADSVKSMLDSIMEASPSIKLEKPNNTKAIYFLQSKQELDSALYYCLKWNPSPSDFGAKQSILSDIYHKKGLLDSAIVYQKTAYQYRRLTDEPLFHVYFMQLADLYGQLNHPDSAAHYARLAYEALQDQQARRTEKRILELEKQYDVAARDAELDKARYHQNLLYVSLAAMALLAGGLFLLFRVQSRKLKSEQVTHSIIRAATKTHQNTLSLLKPLYTKRKTSVEELQAKLKDLSSQLRKDFSQNFSEAIEENRQALTSRQQEVLMKLPGERAKTVFILSELGYDEQEIAEYTCTSFDSVRVTINNIRKIRFPDKPGMTEEQAGKDDG